MNDSETQEVVKVEDGVEDIQQLLRHRNDDYEYGRELLYSAAERLQDIVESAVMLARESEHPRAIEVATHSVTAMADISKKLMGHQQDIEKLNNPGGGSSGGGDVTNNNVNIKMSTKDLLELIKSEE